MLDDSDEDKDSVRPKRKAPAKKHKVKTTIDSDMEVQSSDNEVVDVKLARKPTQRTRLCRGDPKDEEAMPKVEPKVMTDDSRDAASSTTSCSASCEFEEAIVKQEGVLKKVPAPCSGCLDGKTFVFSGVLENLSRKDAVHLVKSCGGSVANSVTRNTKHLVIGATLEQGGNVTEGIKYQEAVAKNVRILTQNEFYNLITEASTAQQAQDLATEKAKIKAKDADVSSLKDKNKLNSYDKAYIVRVLYHKRCMFYRIVLLLFTAD